MTHVAKEIFSLRNPRMPDSHISPETTVVILVAS